MLVQTTNIQKNSKQKRLCCKASSTYQYLKNWTDIYKLVQLNVLPSTIPTFCSAVSMFAHVPPS
jgi:hypothetical protein